MTRLFLFSILAFSFIYGQTNVQYPLNDSYISSKLIKGVPASLKNNYYFSQPENISYAIIHKNDNDTLYFISKKITADSNSYALVLTSNYKITGYDYLNFIKINNDTLVAASSINLPESRIFILYLIQKDNTIFSKICEKIYTVPVKYSADSSRPNVDFGLRLESIIMSANVENKHRTSVFPFNMQLYVGFGFLKYYKVRIRFGVVPGSTNIPFSFKVVLEEGIFLQANLLKSNFYGIGGVSILSNNNECGHGTGDIVYNNGVAIFYCIGLGYETSKRVNLDIMYSVPFDKKFGYDHHSFPSRDYDRIIYGMVTFGFQFAFGK